MATTKAHTNKTADDIIAEAKAEAERIIAEANAKAETIVNSAEDNTEMPEQGDTTYSKEYLQEKVTIKLFKDDDKYKDDVYVSGGIDNGYLIKRGVNVEVPRYIALIIQQSEEQQGRAAIIQEGFQNDYDERAKELGLK